MNMKTTSTTNDAGPSPAPREAHQRAGGNGHSFEQNRIFVRTMLGAAEQARAMRAWVLGDGINAPTAVTSAVWIGIVQQNDNAALFLNFLGGLAGEW